MAGEGLNGAIMGLTLLSVKPEGFQGAADSLALLKSSWTSAHKWGTSQAALTPGTLFTPCSWLKESGVPAGGQGGTPQWAQAACNNCPPGWAVAQRPSRCAGLCAGHWGQCMLGGSWGTQSGATAPSCGSAPGPVGIGRELGIE